jgi:succinate dehydrogenase / fumarate reductase cytochrome b subunit
MRTITRILGSTVGKKAVMGATGLVMVAFVLGHVAGNLLVFRGQHALNAYSAFLKSTGEILWIVRLVLFASVLLHIWAATALTRADLAARPVGYARKVPQASTIASRTIRYGGVVLAAFIVFHLLHFTTGSIRPATFSAEDVYTNVVGSFHVPWVVAIYVVAMAALGLHLYHGVWSSFRSLGLSRPSSNPLRNRTIATVVAVVVWLGFTAIPVAIFAGLVGG